jgi:hypothetical protein
MDMFKRVHDQINRQNLEQAYTSSAIFLDILRLIYAIVTHAGPTFFTAVPRF